MAALASSHEDLTDLDSSVEPTVAPDPVPAEDTPDKITSPCRFFLEGRCHFGARCRNLHPGAANGAHHSDVHRPVQAGLPQLPSGKKPAMKTAEDVISRILWDNQIPAGHFSIGYLDRFLGILEEPFAAFSWEDLASAGPGVLAIPKHRIQYFKYKDRVVWDKATRTDDVFGSTGSRTTILDVIKEEEEAEAFKEKDHHLKEEGEKEAGAGAGEMARHNGQDEDGAAASEQEERLNRIKGEDEIRDAEVEVDNLKSSGDTCTILGGNEVNREKEGSRQALIPENDLTEVGEGNSASQSGRARFFPHSKQRPTHFIAVQVTSSEIRASVQLLQDALCNVCPDLVKFCVPLGTLHLTLCLLHLSTPAEIHKAARVLQELQANSQRLLPPALLVSFNSVEMFYSRVLYLSPVPVLELRRLAQALENAFSQKGLVVIQPPDKDSFHMTIAKIPLKERAVQLPADTSWLPITEDLGTQLVEALYLCEIGKGRRADGFYTTVLKVGLY